MLHSKPNDRYAHNAPTTAPPPTRLTARETKIAQYQNFEALTRQYVRDKEAEVARADPDKAGDLRAQLAGLKKMSEGAQKLLTDLGLEATPDANTADEMGRLNANLQGHRYGHSAEEKTK